MVGSKLVLNERTDQQYRVIHELTITGWPMIIVIKLYYLLSRYSVGLDNGVKEWKRVVQTNIIADGN